MVLLPRPFLEAVFIAVVVFRHSAQETSRQLLLSRLWLSTPHAQGAMQVSLDDKRLIHTASIHLIYWTWGIARSTHTVTTTRSTAVQTLTKIRLRRREMTRRLPGKAGYCIMLPRLVSVSTCMHKEWRRLRFTTEARCVHKQCST